MAEGILFNVRIQSCSKLICIFPLEKEIINLILYSWCLISIQSWSNNPISNEGNDLFTTNIEFSVVSQMENVSVCRFSARRFLRILIKLYSILSVNWIFNMSNVVIVTDVRCTEKLTMCCWCRILIQINTSSNMIPFFKHTTSSVFRILHNYWGTKDLPDTHIRITGCRSRQIKM